MSPRKTPRWVYEWGLLILVVSALPYLVGWLAAALPGEQPRAFTGVLLNVTDTNSYLADMQLGFQGRWLYTMPYSAQLNRPLPLFMLYILLGHLARLTGLSLPLVYHLARLLFSAWFIWLAYRFIARVTTSVNEQKLALALLLFTAGWGWLALLAGSSPPLTVLIPDLWIFDAVSAASILGFPHFVLNMALMLLLLMAGNEYAAAGRWQDGLKAGAAALGISLIHAHQLVVVTAVLGLQLAWHCWETRQMHWPSYLRLGLALIPAGALTLWVSSLSLSDPLLASWLQQGDTYSPPPWSLVILYGPVLLLAVLGFSRLPHRGNTGAQPVWLWFVLTAALLYLPVNFQRRFIEGWHIPVVILAAIGWERVLHPWLARRLSTGALRAILSIGFASVALSPIVLLAITFAEALDTRAPSPQYLDVDELGALEYLRRRASLEDVVLADFEVGNRLPARVGVRSFVGHWSLTPDFYLKLETAQQFLRGDMHLSERGEFLNANGIDYVFIGPQERLLGASAPEVLQGLEQVYSSPTVSLYRVNPEAP